MAAVLLAASLAIVGCQSQSGTESPRSAVAETASALHTVKISAQLDHIHAAQIDPAGDAVLVATHAGIWRIDSDGTAQQVGQTSDDFMAFTANSDRWLASGHPGRGSTSPNPLGLVESLDNGESWQPVSRSGETDFHALASRKNTVVGFDGASGVIRSTDSGKTWTLASATQVGALAFSAERLFAVTQRGVEVSSDAGTTFSLLSGSPRAVLLSSAGSVVWVVDDNDIAWASNDSGQTWQQRAFVGRGVAGLVAVDFNRAYSIAGGELTVIG